MILEIFKNNIEVLIPEFFITTVFLTLLLFGVLIRQSDNNKIISFFKVINLLTIFSLIIALILTMKMDVSSFIIANGAFKIDKLTQFFKILLIYSTIICVIIQKEYNIQQKNIRFENNILILISLLGLMLLVSSYNLIGLYLAIEVHSLCFYILTASNRKSIFSAEAGLKYFILGAIASGFILYGSSILYGVTGSLNFGHIFLIISNLNSDINIISTIIYGFLFLLIGLLFKLGAVPFHFWLPDVYEGAPNNITAFFSIVPKISYIGLLIRLNFYVFNDISYFYEFILYFTALSSILVGSLISLQQKKFKRLMAYSSIVHTGFILMGFTTNSLESIENILLYVVIYVLMNIIIWTFYLSFNINSKPIKFLTDLSNTYKLNPLLFFIISLTLFSMAGIPPLAGFFSKMFILLTLIQNNYFGLSILAILISVVSTFYYIRLIKIIYFENKKKTLFLNKISKLNSYIISIHFMLIILFFIFPEYLLIYIHKICLSLLI